MHLDTFKQDVHRWAQLEIHGVGVVDLLDLAQGLHDLCQALGIEVVAYDEQIVDMRVEFDAEVVLVSERHQVIGVSVLAGVVVEEGVGQGFIQQDILESHQVEVQLLVDVIGELIVDERAIDSEDVDVIEGRDLEFVLLNCHCSS